MNPKNRLRLLLAAFSCLALPAQADVSISYLGADTTNAAAWRSTSVTKNATFDLDGDNAYGTAGYAIISPSPAAGSALTVGNWVNEWGQSTRLNMFSIFFMVWRTFLSALPSETERLTEPGWPTAEGAGDLVFYGGSDHTAAQGIQNLTINGGLVHTDYFGQWNSEWGQSTRVNIYLTWHGMNRGHR